MSTQPTPQPQTLAQRIRAKFPGTYDDLSDTALEQKVLAKYPQYSDLPRTQVPTSQPQQPGFGARFSEQMGLTQHPIDQLVSELQRIKNDPTGTLWQSIKQPVLGLRDLAYNLTTKPVQTIQQVTGGPQFAQDVKSGNYAGAAGTLAGGAAQVALMKAPEATVKAPGAVDAAAEKMYQSALKPGPGTYSTGEVKSMVNTGLSNQIPVSASGAERLDSLVKDLQGKVKAQIHYGSTQGATVDPAAVANRTDALKARFSNQVNPNADLQAIDSAKQEFLANNPSPIPAADAQTMKQGTYQQLKGKSYGELKGASIEAQKALARGIKEELEVQFPEIKGLNAQEGQLIGLDGALDHALRRINNHQLLGIGTPLAVGAGGVVTGTPLGAAAAGAMKLILDNPTVKSKLAISLARASRGGVTIGGAQAKIAAYASALEKASQSTPSGSQGVSAP